MATNRAFPAGQEPKHEVTKALLKARGITYEVDAARGVLVLATADELLVHTAAHERFPGLEAKLGSVARKVTRPEGFGNGDLELWRVNGRITAANDSIVRARQLVLAVDPHHHGVRVGAVNVPPVSPNHVCVVAPKYDVCPYDAPVAVPAANPDYFGTAPGSGPQVVVIDTGYMTGIGHPLLDLRVTPVAGQWLDLDSQPPQIRLSPPDGLPAQPGTKLGSLVGHGTFIAGIVAHASKEARITAVGLRRDAVALTAANPLRLFASEFDVASALEQHAAADIVSCGFAFPTLGGLSSIAFAAAMTVLDGSKRPAAVVAPAGNEGVEVPFWPAAHPHVIGVASSEQTGKRRAKFSNWGSWADCSTRGERVRSAYVFWQTQKFDGWATWSGTSFAAPKVAAAIASLVARSNLEPRQAFAELVKGWNANPPQLTGRTFNGVPLPDLGVVKSGLVSLPQLRLG